MLSPRNIGRYKDLLVLFTKYGRRDFRLTLTPDDLMLSDDSNEGFEPHVRDRARAFATALKQMGPTYVKFGQVLSTRPDIVPPEYINELETLQDSIEPFSYADIERIVEEELGVRISKAFAEFDVKPLAAASLGQVHRAVLRDGRDVVVKVQRPKVREQVRQDLELFTEIAQTLEQHTDLGRKMNLTAAIDQARLTLFNELNYVQEARNTETIARNLRDFPQIHVPRVIHDYSTSKILTTELVRGHKISKLTPLALIENDYAELAGVITRAYLKQICVDGFWHSDPHPGNVFVRDTDGEPQIVLLDFGMVSKISHEFQDEIIKLLLAISTNRGVDVAEACMRVSEMSERFETTRFVREISSIVANFHDVDFSQVSIGQLMFNVIGVANSNELIVPPEMAMLAKTLLHLDGITKKLDEKYEPQRVIRDYAEELITLKLKQNFNPRNFYPALLDLNQLILDLPHRTREILDLTAASRLTFGIKMNQAEEFLAGIHKVANRITVGIVIAALLVSSSMMMRIPSRFQIFGYPGLAVIGYLAASVAAFFLIATTFLRDRRDQERAKLKGK
jgi:predicted unusual protein kinase regulating ubiquinone biosynthesis (AarF/ABC1/UbiB family)